MTEAGTSFKKKKSSNSSADGRISTHPSYTEYTWDSVSPRRTGGSPSMTASKKAGETTASFARVNNVGNGNSSPEKPISGRAVSGKSKTAGGVGTRTAAKAESKAAPRARAERAEKVKRKPVVAIHTIAVDKKYAFPISIVLVAICFTALILATITTSVQISEIVAENALLTRQYNNLLSDENELRLLLETRDDLRVVETLAKEEYGMVKKDQVERYYLTVHKEDKIEIVEEIEEEREGIFDGIVNFGSSIAKRIKDFFGF